MREQWKAADSPQRRAVLLHEASPPLRTGSATHARTRFGLRGRSGTAAPGHLPRARGPSAQRRRPAAPVRDIMSEIPGIDLDRAEWPYIGAKAGNLPGDLTFSWYAVDRTGQAWVVSFQTQLGATTARTRGGWVMMIIKQVFAMLPATADRTRAQRPHLPAEVQHRAARRRDVDAPERFRRCIEHDEHGGADHGGWVTPPLGAALGSPRRASPRTRSIRATTDSPRAGPDPVR